MSVLVRLSGRLGWWIGRAPAVRAPAVRTMAVRAMAVRTMALSLAAAMSLTVCCNAGEPTDPRMEYARWLLAQAGDAKKAELKIDASLAHPEAFSLREADGRWAVVGGGPAGALYGVREWIASSPAARLTVQKPDFDLRGTVLFLMKEASYDYQLTPKEFPWFFDRPLLTRYFDYLLENRFNTIFLWSGHLFPSIVQMPEYPDATDLSKSDLLRNQQQFRWFTRECAKRNISVLLHFYQIHIPKPLAKSRNIPVHYSEPNDFVRKFVRYSLGRFLAEFDSVGLYVCPGEALHARYQPEWIRDVIFAAARDSGRNPVIVVRDWTLDAERFKKVCKNEYDNLYTELKHNVEMIVSPVPDERHALWKGVARRHIVNVHEVADVKPFRWGSPTFIREMVGHWKKAGIDGAEVYGMVSWRWPYALDKLEPGQTTYWPAGHKLLSFQRDAIWLEAIGRYLWKTDRDPAGEEAYWTARLAARFGNERAGDVLRRWYDTSGPILPGLQNLTHVRNMNFYPTAVGAEQRVDLILSADGADYPTRPVDAYFFDRYKKKYAAPHLAKPMTLSIAKYADMRAKGEKPSDRMTPDRVADLLVELAQESLALAIEARQAATANQEEVARFQTDSQALVYIAQAWRLKVRAAIEKRILQTDPGDPGDPDAGAEHRRAMLRNLEESIQVYEKLVALTDKTYVTASDMLMRLNWHNGLAAFRADLVAQRHFLQLFDVRRQPGVHWLETEDMLGNWKLGANYAGYSGRGFRVSDGPGQRGTVLRKKLTIDRPGRYAVWARGLLAGPPTRAFAVEVGPQKFPPTHAENGPPSGEFVWRKAGEVQLDASAVEIVVRDAGPGFECPDVILLTPDLKWKAP